MVRGGARCGAGRPGLLHGRTKADDTRRRGAVPRLNDQPQQCSNARWGITGRGWKVLMKRTGLGLGCRSFPRGMCAAGFRDDLPSAGSVDEASLIPHRFCRNRCIPESVQQEVQSFFSVHPPAPLPGAGPPAAEAGLILSFSFDEGWKTPRQPSPGDSAAAIQPASLLDQPWPLSPAEAEISYNTSRSQTCEKNRPATRGTPLPSECGVKNH